MLLNLRWQICTRPQQESVQNGAICWFADAVDVVEERLATLEANQSQTTPTGIQLITEAIGAHGYIVGCLLQGRPDLALEESRKWVSAFGQAAEIVSAQDAAGIKVNGE